MQLTIEYSASKINTRLNQAITLCQIQGKSRLCFYIPVWNTENKQEGPACIHVFSCSTPPVAFQIGLTVLLLSWSPVYVICWTLPNCECGNSTTSKKGLAAIGLPLFQWQQWKLFILLYSVEDTNDLYKGGWLLSQLLPINVFFLCLCMTQIALLCLSPKHLYFCSIHFYLFWSW